MDNIKVGIRVRPLLPKDNGLQEQWDTGDERVSPKSPPSNPYFFDHVFGTSVTTDHIYQKLAEPIVEGVMEGINGTIFAYGQTASGKTFTMMGEEPDHPGITLQACDHIFKYIQQHPEREHLIRASYLEIYNETLTDLLNSHQKLRIREDRERNFLVHRLTEEPVTSQEDIYALIEAGESSRSFGKTYANEHSSRSHAIFKLVIESRVKDEELSDGTIRVASLSLVDLAGSERVGVSGATGKQFKEGTNINRSLHVLGKVISKLSEGNIGHVPYRESKLTSILQPSIGGNSKTCIICTISPCELGESHSTLQFASRAKTIKNKPIVNEVVCGEEALRKKLKSYEKEIAQLKDKLEQGLPDQEHEALTRQLAQSELQTTRLEERMKTLEGLIVGVSASTEKPKKTKTLRRMTMCPSQLSRNTRATESPLPCLESVPFKPPVAKAVKFAPTPCKIEESFQVQYSPAEFKELLEEMEDVKEQSKPARIRGRPSFLPTPDIHFDDSLDETPVDVQSYSVDHDETLATLERRCADLERDRCSMSQELEEKDEVIRQLEEDLTRELEEKLFDKSMQEVTHAPQSELTEHSREPVVSTIETLTREKVTLQGELAKALEHCKELELNSLSVVEVPTQDKVALQTELAKALERCRELEVNTASIVEGLTREKVSLQEELTSTLERCKELELNTLSAVECVSQEKATLQEELRDTLERCKLLEANNLRVTQEKATLQEELAKALERWKLEASTLCVETLTQENATLQEELTKALERCKELEANTPCVESLTQEKATLQEELTKTLERCKEFEADTLCVESLTQEKAPLQEELTKSLERCKELEANTPCVESLTQEKATLQEELTKALERCKELDAITPCVESLTQEKATLQEELTKALERCKEPEANTVSAVEGVDILECYEEENKELQRQLEEKERVCSALERKLEETKDRYTTDLQFLQESVTSLHNGLAAAKTSIEESVVEKAKLESELKDTVASLKQSQRTISDHLETIRGFEDERKSLLTQLNERDAMLATMEQNHPESDLVSEFKAKISDLERQLSEAEKDADLREELELSNQQLQAKEMINSDLERRLSEQEGQLKELDQHYTLKVDSLTEIVSTLEKKLESAVSKLKLCEEELQKTQTKLVEKSEESEDYYNEWFRAQDERDIAERREHQIELELNELKEEFQVKVSGLQGKLSEAEKYTGLMEELELSNQQLKAKEKVIFDLERRLSKEEDKYKELEQHHALKIDSLTVTVSTLEEKLESAVSELKLCEEELKKTQTKLAEKSEESEDYYNEWIRAQNERDLAEHNEHQLELELDELKKESKAKEREMSDLERKLSEVERDTDLMKELELSNQQLKAKELVISDLEKGLSEQEGQLKELEQHYTFKVDSLVETVSTLEEKLESAVSELKLCEEELRKTQNKLREKSEECEVYYNEGTKALEEKDLAEGNEYQLELELDKLKKEFKEKEMLITEIQQNNVTLSTALREREDDLTKLKQDLSVKEEKENQDPEHYPSLKQQIKDICRLRTADQRRYKNEIAEVQDTLAAVREDNRRLKEKIQGMAAKPPVSAFTNAPAGVVTEVLYHDLHHEFSKLKESSDKEREDMMRYRRERNLFRAKFLAVKKLCNCRALERAQNDPNFILTD